MTARSEEEDMVRSKSCRTTSQNGCIDDIVVAGKAGSSDESIYQ
jgi:hypothetical protein